MKRIVLILGLLLAGLGFAVTAHAEDPHVNVAQGYQATESITNGALVAASKTTAGGAQLASVDDADNLIGVAVPADESMLSVSQNASSVQVATSGVVMTLVSDVNGTIKKGDRIVASPLRGVGMKASTSGRMVGVARADFTAASDTQTATVKTKDGKSKVVKFGRLLVVLDVSYYSSGGGSVASVVASYVPPIVQDLSNTFVGKQVSPIRVVLSFILLLVALLISIVLVYSAVRSSIISIGRNPLSQPAVRKSLYQVLGFVIVILLVTLIAIYFILSR